MTGLAAFRAGLLDPATPPPDGLTDGAGAPAGKRYDVYRNNVTHSLIGALETAFPLVRRILGPQNFDRLAPDYLREHPPKSPLMMQYGVDFPAFLATSTQLSHLGYLPDCARLDLALRASYHAADADPFDLAAFKSLPPDQMMDQRIAVAPTTRIIRSRWPLYAIWQFNMVQGAPKPHMVAQDVIITRPEFDRTPHLLPLGGADWMGHLKDGVPLGEAHRLAIQAQPDFDLAANLTLAFGSSAFCAQAAEVTQ